MFTAEPQSTAHLPTATAPDVDSRSALPFRLLSDETVLGTFPMARTRRPLGRVASYLFITDSRVIYSAEAKALRSSSTHLKEYQVQTVTGVEVGRERGLNPIGLAVAVGTVLNVIVLTILASLAGATSEDDLFGSTNPLVFFAPLLGFLAVASLVIGIVAVVILSRSTADLTVVGPGQEHSIARGGQDLATAAVLAVLAIVTGPFISLAVIAWAILRELGMFRATDAKLYAEANSVDRISYEVGALILDVQARGKLAGQN